MVVLLYISFNSKFCFEKYVVFFVPCGTYGGTYGSRNIFYSVILKRLVVYVCSHFGFCVILVVGLYQTLINYLPFGYLS